MSSIVLELLQKLETGGDVEDADLAALTSEEYSELLREWRDKKWHDWLFGGKGGALFGERGATLPPTGMSRAEAPSSLFGSQSGGAFVHPANRKTRRSDER